MSTTGITTNKFNKIILNKIDKDYKNTPLELEKIKFKFDIKKLSLFIETKNPKIIHQNLVFPIENVKVYLNFISLLKSKVQIDKINVLSKEIDIKELKELMIKIKPQIFNSLIINKAESGKLNSNLDLYFDNNLKVTDLIARGEVKEMNAKLSNNLFLADTSFNSFFDKSDLILTNTKTKLNGMELKEGNLYIAKDKLITLKSEFSTDLSINQENLKDYSSLIKNLILKII